VTDFLPGDKVLVTGVSKGGVQFTAASGVVCGAHHHPEVKAPHICVKGLPSIGWHYSLLPESLSHHFEKDDRVVVTGFNRYNQIDLTGKPAAYAGITDSGYHRVWMLDGSGKHWHVLLDQLAPLRDETVTPEGDSVTRDRKALNDAVYAAVMKRWKTHSDWTRSEINQFFSEAGITAPPAAQLEDLPVGSLIRNTAGKLAFKVDSTRLAIAGGSGVSALNSVNGLEFIREGFTVIHRPVS